ncbi:neprilysin-4-like [Musca vetustissima]|uniref:neprilysin-4-like n=1 Tax=Musca vetustissima TaxID=27455 RepID=UPI002AB5E478|nr:neprilysin-4-like [Musca vetustissima]
MSGTNKLLIEVISLVTNADPENRSQKLRNYMNASADPCENFYQFACGNWKHLHPASEDEPQRDAFTEGVKFFYGRLNKLLTSREEDADAEHLPTTPNEIKLKNFYNSCLNQKNRNQSEYVQQLRKIAQEFGGMPLLEEEVNDTWQENEFDWQTTIARISKKYGFTIIVGYGIIPNHHNASENMIYLKIHEFEIQNGYLQHRDSYRATIVKNLKNFFNVNQTKAEGFAQEYVDFEQKLWQAKEQDSKMGSDSISIAELQEKFAPDFDIYRLMNISYGSIPPNLQIDITHYVASLIDITKTTPKRIVANYIFYNLLMPFKFKTSISQSDLERRCITQVELYLPKLVSQFYYRHYNLQNYEVAIFEFWNRVKAAIRKALNSNKMSWFDAESRKFALRKLDTLTMVMPNYQEYNNCSGEYENVEISPDDFVENLKTLISLEAIKKHKSLYENPNYIEMGLDMFSPTYVAKSNMVIIPVSVLQNPFFWAAENPHNLNYAHLGFLLCHELMHAFTAVGRYFDHTGKLTGEWENEEELEKRQDCLYDQYHNYSFAGHNLPQDSMQSENSADNAGVLIAYEIYNEWYTNSSQSKAELQGEVFEDLYYDAKQLFFIHYSQMWCSDIFEVNTSVVAASDEHSPDEFRAFVPLTNLEQFAQAFQCAKGTPMNPVDKCEQLLLL